MLTPSAPGGGTYCDIEVRYSLGRGESGIYAYAIFSHPAAYGAMGIGESRYVTKINPDVFDWLSVDADRNMLMCSNRDEAAGVVVHAKEQRILSTGIYKNSVEHKYSYTAMQYKVPALGWSGTRDHIGICFINPTTEYFSGGAASRNWSPTSTPIMTRSILDYWRGTHYGGGASCNIRAGENGAKSLARSLSTATRGRLQYPISGGPGHADGDHGQPNRPAGVEGQRHGTVAGRAPPSQGRKRQVALRLGQWRGLSAQRPARKCDRSDRPERPAGRDDETAPPDSRPGSSRLRGRLRCLSAAAALAGRALAGGAGTTQPARARTARGPIPGGFGGFGGPRLVDWAHDAKFYQFWNDGTPDGKFTITNVRPGTYTLHAFADGVLGEFAQANITVVPARP